MAYNNLRKKKSIEENRFWKKAKADDFHFDLIEYYFKHKVRSNEFQVIDNQIINDIDYQELFLFLDRTHSVTGQQYLYNQLLTTNMQPDFDEQEHLIDFLDEKEEKRIKVQLLLSKLNKRNAYYIVHLFLDGYISKPKWFWVIRTLSFASFALFILSFLWNKLFLLLLFIYITNMIIHFWNKNNIMVYTDSIPQLPLFCKIAKELAKMDILPESKSSVLASVASINELRNTIKFFKLDTSLKSEIEALLLFVWEIIKILLLIEPLVVFDVLKKLEIKKGDIHTLFEFLGKIDSAISILTIRKEMPCFCKPLRMDTQNLLEFTDIYHPLIPDCVPNSLQTKGKSILLTGSNMSGKTTFIRTIAINLLLAQTINTCFAKEFKYTRTRLFSAIRISDDLLNDTSYYFEEVLIIKNMINESHSPLHNVFFLDEIFKGTNTIERIAAGKAVLSHLVKSVNTIVFVSTHDIELTDLLSKEYDLYHFTEVIQDEQIHFDYKLKPGNLSTKNAIRILEINNYPKDVVDDARKISKTLQERQKQEKF
jgi:hypothetical protein